MFQAIKQTVAGALILILAIFLPLLVAAPVHAQIDESSKAAACAGLGAAGADCGTQSSSNSITQIVGVIVNILSWVIGVAAVIMILIGGFRYVTSGGDSNNISAAKNTILYAIVGLVVAAMAQVLVQFVLKQATTAQPSSQGGNSSGGVNMCVVDGQGNFVSNPDPSRQCAMP